MVDEQKNASDDPGQTSAKKNSIETPPRRIWRSRNNRYIAGVCGGVAEYLNVDSTLVRVLWVAAVFLGFSGFIAYLAFWILVPEKPPTTEEQPVAPREASGNFGLIAGFVLIAVGLIFLANQHGFFWGIPWQIRHFFSPFWDVGTLAAILVIGLGFYLLFHKTDNTKQSQEGKTSGGTMDFSKKLTRSVSDRKIGGVCGGLANYFNIDSSLVRVGFVLLALPATVFLVVA